MICEDRVKWSQLPVIVKVATIISLLVGGIWLILFLVGLIKGMLLG